MSEIETEAKPASFRSIVIKTAIAVAIGVGIMLLPRPEGLPPEGQRFLGLLVAAVVLWVSEALPIGVTALLAGGGMIFLKVQTAERAWAPFASPAVMFVLMIIMFGVVLNEVGLANRVMYYLLKVAGTKVKRLSFFVAMGCTITSTVFHDATITVIMVYAFLPVFMGMGLKPGQGHRLPAFFFMLIPLAASAGGFGTLLGGGRNPLALEILAKFTGGATTIGFMKYIEVQFPVCMLTSVATWAIVWVLCRPKEKELTGVSLAYPGKMSGKELGVVLVFLATFVLWFLGDLTKWHYSVPAALAILGFTMPGWCSFKTICDRFPWESWIVFGAGVSLGGAMLDSGAGKYLAQSLLPLLEGQSKFVVYYGFGLFGAVLSSMMSNSAAAALSLAITLPMSKLMGLAPESVTLLAPMATSFIMLVIGCPPTIIAYSTGYFSQAQFIKTAVPWALLLLLLCVLGIMVYWPLIGFPGK